MKRLFTILAVALLTAAMWAQNPPQKMSYQAVVRNTGGSLVTSQAIGMKISILQGSPTGSLIYQEIYNPNPQTNANGLVSIEIGGGIPLTGIFSTIDWAAGPFFLKTETDPAGGTNYTITGTTQLLSVPYALYAKSAANGFSGNYNDLTNKPALFSGSYIDLTNKPLLFSGNYNDLTNKPLLFDGTWTSLTGKPSTLAGYGITDGMNTSHAANGITLTNINNWNAAYGWGNHSGLYRPISWVPAWSDITGKPVFATVATSGSYNDLLNLPTLNITNWNTAYGWGNHASAGYVPNTRTITINGTAFDLSDNRSWSVGTVTSVGLSLPNIFTLSGSPITTIGTLAATFASQTANQVFASPNSSTGTPAFRTLVAADIPGLNWSKITSGKPTTLAGYGITDAVNTTGNQTIAGDKTFTGIITVNVPVNASDAANKRYIDNLLTAFGIIPGNYAGTITDIDGNLYATVTIGTQIWIAQNLKTTKYNDGTAISLVTDNTVWSNLTTPGYCWYNNDEANKDMYGALYNWYTVNTGNLCPSGWHVPTDPEWTTLENYLITNGFNYDGTTTGNKIAKSLASSFGWSLSTATGVVGNTDYPAKRNATGFTALPGGYRGTNGAFSSIESYGYWWLATQYDATNAWSRNLGYSSSSVGSGSNNKKYGFYIRCIRN